MTMGGMPESPVLYKVQYLRSQHLYIWYMKRITKCFTEAEYFWFGLLSHTKKYYKYEETTFSADGMFNNFLLRLQLALI
jgi:hypothetical protein